MNHIHAAALENDLVNRNNATRNIDGEFGEVKAGVQMIGCSDCCSSNGNSCDPRDPTYPQEA